MGDRKMNFFFFLNVVLMQMEELSVKWMDIWNKVQRQLVMKACNKKSYKKKEEVWTTIFDYVRYFLAQNRRVIYMTVNLC